MTHQPKGDIERLAALIEAKLLADLESRAEAGEAPSTSELNALRRLVTWAEGERELAQVRALTTASEDPGTCG